MMLRGPQSRGAPNLEGPRGIFPTSLYGQSAPGCIQPQTLVWDVLNGIPSLVGSSQLTIRFLDTINWVL
jgi:hypothetical protein